MGRVKRVTQPLDYCEDSHRWHVVVTWSKVQVVVKLRGDEWWSCIVCVDGSYWSTPPPFRAGFYSFNIEALFSFIIKNQNLHKPKQLNPVFFFILAQSFTLEEHYRWKNINSTKMLFTSKICQTVNQVVENQTNPTIACFSSDLKGDNKTHSTRVSHVQRRSGKGSITVRQVRA